MRTLKVITVLFLSIIFFGSANAQMSVMPSSFNVGSAAGSVSFTLSNIGVRSFSWTGTDNASWITLSSASGTLAAEGSTTITINYSANTGVARTGTVTITASGVTGSPATITVNQVAAPNYISFNPASVSAVYGGGSYSVTASGTHTTPAITSVTKPSWVTSATYNSSGIISLSVPANTGAARSGTVTVSASNVVNGSGSFTISQAAAPNTLSLSKTSISPAYSGATTSATVSGSWQTPTGVTASANQSWIHTTVSGTTINITVDANAGASRSGTITVGASNGSGSPTISISQAAAPNTLSASPSSVSHGYSTATTSVTLSGAWQLPTGASGTTSQSWIHILTVGEKVLQITTDANTGAARSGSVTASASNGAAPITIPVSQAAAPNTLSLNTTSISPAYSGMTTSATVSGSWQTPTGVTASANQSWIHTTVSGTTINITVDANAGASRSGTITVGASNGSGSPTITVNQAAAPNTLSASPSSISSTYSGGTTGITLSGSWQTPTGASGTPSQSWIHITSNGERVLMIGVDANTGAARTGSVTASASNGSGTVSIPVSQSAAPNTLSLSKTSISPAYSGATTSATVSGSWQTPTGVTASANQSWIHTTVSGTTINIAVDANAGASRSGTITVGASNGSGSPTISISQAAAPNTLSASPSSISHGYSTATTSVTLSGAWQLPTGASGTTSQSWIHILSNGERILQITTDANTGAARSGSVTASASNGSGSISIPVNQAAAPNTLSLSKTSISPAYSGMTTSATVSGSWQTPTGVTASANQSWIHTTVSGTTINITIDPNSGTARTGTITVGASNGPNSPTISVSQSAGPNYMSFNPNPVNADNGGNYYNVTVSGTHTTPVLTGATSGDSWIHIFSYEGHTVRIQTDANTGAPRSGTVTVNASNVYSSETFTVSQAGGPNYISLTTNSISAPNTSFSTPVSVGARWQKATNITAIPDSSWLHTSVSDTIVNITVDLNSGKARTGTVAVSASNGANTQIITIDQAAGPNYLSFSPDTVQATNQFAYYTVYANGTHTIPDITDVTSNVTWAKLFSLDGRRITISVDPNLTGGPRSGLITVIASNVQSAKSFVIKQAAGANNISLTAYSISSPNSGNTTTIGAAGSWQKLTGLNAVPDSSWIIPTIDDTTITIQVLANTGKVRTGTVTISASNGSNTQVITVSQAAGPNYLSFSPDTVHATNQFAYYSITASGTHTIPSITDVNSNVSWAKVFSINGRIIVISVDPNATGGPRTGLITVSASNVYESKVFAVKQDAGANNISLTAYSSSLPDSGGLSTVMASGSWQKLQEVSAVPDTNSTWILPTVNDTVITIQVLPNYGKSRIGTVTVSATNGSNTQVITVNQAAGPNYLSFDKNPLEVPAAPGNYRVKALGTHTNPAITSVTESSILITILDYDANYINLLIGQNNGGPRTDTVFVNATGVVNSPGFFVINQAGTANNLWLTSYSDTVGPEDTTISVSVGGTWQKPSGVKVTENLDWITPVINDTTITFSISENTGPMQNGDMVISANNGADSVQFSITQTSGTKLIVTPLDVHADSLAGTAKFVISKSGNETINWTAADTSSWFDIYPISGEISASGEEDTVTVSYGKNTGKLRSDIITVEAPGFTGSPKVVTITQDAGPNNMYFDSILVHMDNSPDQFVMTVRSSHSGFSIASVRPDSSWLSVMNAEGKNIRLQISQNYGKKRTSKVWVECTGVANSPQYFEVEQEAGPNNIWSAVDSIEFDRFADDSTISVGGWLEKPENVKAIVSDASWITATVTDTIINISVKRNYKDAKSGTVTISADNCGNEEIVHIKQASGLNYLSADPDTIFASYTSKDTMVEIKGANIIVTEGIMVDNKSTWISTSTGGTKIISVHIEPNNASARKDSFMVSATGAADTIPVYVIQKAAPNIIVQDTLIASQNDSLYNIKLDYKWSAFESLSIQADTSWMQSLISDAGFFKLHINANNGLGRHGRVILKDPVSGDSTAMLVLQRGRPNITIEPDTIKAGSAVMSQVVTINTVWYKPVGGYTATCDSQWVHVMQIPGGEETKYKYQISVDANTGITRTAKVKIRQVDGGDSSYVYIIQKSPYSRYYYVKDHLGSIRQTVDEKGEIVSAQNYYAFGSISESVDNSDTWGKYKYTEKERDKETDYDYFGARYYDADLGRWHSVDPMADKYPGWSPYNYTLNMPLIYIDPNGMIVVFKDEELEKLHNKLYNETDDKGNYVNGKYRSQYDKLHGSKEEYNVSFGKTDGDGSFDYNGSSFDITLEKTSSLPLDVRMSHEFQHGVQYENGEMGFYSRDGGKNWETVNYDITDETNAWDASLEVADLSDYFNLNGRSTIGQYSDKTSQKDKESFLISIGYTNRKDGPMNNENIQGNEAYQVLLQQSVKKAQVKLNLVK